MASLQAITIKNINIGGIADSEYVGGTNSVAECVGLDIHSKPGLITVNQALTKESGSLIAEFVRCGVACSDGNTYFFGSTTGKIFKRSPTGTYSLEATASPSAGAPGILDAKEYQGYIYYATQNRLGRWQIGTAWATRSDNYANFTNGDLEWHPMRILNLVLYIGDKNLIAQVDAGVFSANALDVENPLRMKSLGQLGTDLLSGTFVNFNVGSTQIFRWNTWSVSFTNSDPIAEVGINSFLDTDNFVLVNAGTKGNLYLYDGSQLDLFKQIPGNWDSTAKAEVLPNASFNFNGLPLFGMSKISGNPCLLGIYSIARKNRNYPYVLNLEYVISTGHTENIKIGCIVGGGDIFFVSWYDETNNEYGIDKLDLSKKSPVAYFTTRVSDYDRMESTVYGEVKVGYRKLPPLTNIEIEKKVNDGAFEPMSAVDDTIHNMVNTEAGIDDAVTLQVKVKLISNANNAPEVEQAVIELGPGQ